MYSITRGANDTYLDIVTGENTPTGVILKFWVDGAYRDVVQSLTFRGTSDSIYPVVIGKNIPTPMKEKIANKMSDYLMRIDNIVYASSDDEGASMAHTLYDGDMADVEDKTVVGGESDSTINIADRASSDVHSNDVDGIHANGNMEPDVSNGDMEDNPSVPNGDIQGVKKESVNSLKKIFKGTYSITDVIAESYKINADVHYMRGGYVAQSSINPKDIDVFVNGKRSTLCENTVRRMAQFKPKSVDISNYLIVVCGSVL